MPATHEPFRNPGMTKQDVTPKTHVFNGYLSHKTSHQYDPLVTGYAFIKWLKVPSWIDQDYPWLCERNFKSFSGINDIELDAGGISAGFTGNEISYAKGSGQKAEGFTLKHQEFSGSPLTSIYNHWVSGIRDPKTGIATYPGTYKMEYHSDNHTGTLLYVVTRPDADNFDGTGHNIEFAALYTHCMPTKIAIGHFNYDTNSHDMPEVEQSFKGYMHIGQNIMELAKDLSNTHIYTFETEGENPEETLASAYGAELR